jgi:hypothetical protein
VPRIKRDDGKVKMILPPFAGELNGFTLLFEAFSEKGKWKIADENNQ